MPRDSLIEMQGVLVDAMGGGFYSARIDQTNAVIRVKLSGRMKRRHIRVLPGDKVKIAVSPYDMSHGMIVFRSK